MRFSGAAGADLEVYAFLGLKMGQDAKEILGGGVAFRPEHPHETGGRYGGRLFQLAEADGGVDVVAQDRPTRPLVAGEHEVDGLTKQRLAEFRLLLGAVADGFAKVFGQCHGCFLAASATL